MFLLEAGNNSDVSDLGEVLQAGWSPISGTRSSIVFIYIRSASFSVKLRNDPLHDWRTKQMHFAVKSLRHKSGA